MWIPKSRFAAPIWTNAWLEAIIDRRTCSWEAAGRIFSCRHLINLVRNSTFRLAEWAQILQKMSEKSIGH